MTLKYTSFTCTHYADGDVLGKFLAYVAIAPVLLMFYRASRFYSRREVHEAVFFAGCLANEALARFLKHYLQQPRPSSTCMQLNLCQSHGMPSSHTQMMFFILVLSTFLTLYRRVWTKPRVPVLKATPAKDVTQTLLAVAEFSVLAIASILVGASRVYLGYHSMDQVVGGAAIGAIAGLLWFGIMLNLEPLYALVASWPVSYWLDIRNTWDLGAGVHTFERDFINVSMQGSSKKDK